MYLPDEDEKMGEEEKRRKAGQNEEGDMGMGGQSDWDNM